MRYAPVEFLGLTFLVRYFIIQPASNRIPKMAGESSRRVRSTSAWTPKGQVSWRARRLTKLSGQGTPQIFISGKLDAKRFNADGASRKSIFRTNLSGNHTGDARRTVALPLFIFGFLAIIERNRIRRSNNGSSNPGTHRVALPRTDRTLWALGENQRPD